MATIHMLCGFMVVHEDRVPPIGEKPNWTKQWFKSLTLFRSKEAAWANAEEKTMKNQVALEAQGYVAVHVEIEVHSATRA